MLLLFITRFDLWMMCSAPMTNPQVNISVSRKFQVPTLHRHYSLLERSAMHTAIGVIICGVYFSMQAIVVIFPAPPNAT